MSAITLWIEKRGEYPYEKIWSVTVSDSGLEIGNGTALGKREAIIEALENAGVL